MRSPVKSWIRKYGLFILLLLALVLLLLPSALRSSQGGFLVGSESYYQLRLSELVQEQGFLFLEDPLSYGGRAVVEELGWPWLLSFSPDLLSQVLPFLAGLLSLLVFYFLVKEIRPEVAELASSFFILSPVYVYVFTISSPYALAFLFSLLGALFFVRKSYYFSLISFFLVSFFSFGISAVLFGCFLVYFLFKKRHSLLFALSSVSILASFFLQFYSLFEFSLEAPFSLIQGDVIPYLFSNIFSNFGSSLGVGFFMFVLSLIGAYSLWSKKYLYFVSYFVFFVAFVLSYYLSFLFYLLLLLIPFFAACGVFFLWERKWSSSSLKHITLFVLFCGLLFTPLSYVNEFVDYQPNKAHAEVIFFLEGLESSTVFSRHDAGDFISYAGHKVVSDDHFVFSPNASQRLKDSEFVLRTGNFSRTKEIFEFYDVKYIYLDVKMKEELYGGRDIDLLALLHRNPQSFLKVFDNSEVELWLFLDHDAV